LTLSVPFGVGVTDSDGAALGAPVNGEPVPATAVAASTAMVIPALVAATSGLRARRT
jgi:hypothetical protein